MSAQQSRSASQHTVSAASPMQSSSLGLTQSMGNAAMQDMLRARLAQSATTTDSEQEKPKWTLADLLALTHSIAPDAFKQARKTLRYDPKVKLQNSKLRGMFHPAKGRRLAYITIKPSLDLEAAAQVLVLELGNASRQAEYTEVDKVAETGTMDQETYAKETERVEFGSRKEAIEAHERGTKNGDLTGDGLFKDVDFETYYKHPSTQKHANLYRKQWDSSHSAAYDNVEWEKAHATRTQERADKKVARKSKTDARKAARKTKTDDRKAAKKAKADERKANKQKPAAPRA